MLAIGKRYDSAGCAAPQMRTEDAAGFPVRKLARFEIFGFGLAFHNGIQIY